MIKEVFINVSDKEKDEAIEHIIAHASPRPEFYIMMILSVAMAAFGILLNSIVILIGSMLVAPLLYPTLSLSLGVIMTDEKLIRRSTSTILKSSGLALITGFLVAIIFSSGSSIEQIPIVTVIAGSQPSLLYVIVAVIAGFAASFAIAKPYLNDTLPGVAIAVALVPPLAASGVLLAHFQWGLMINALVLFVANVAGIIFSGLVVFSLLRLAVKRKVAQEAVKTEETIIKKEEKQAQQASAGTEQKA